MFTSAAHTTHAIAAVSPVPMLNNRCSVPGSLAAHLAGKSGIASLLGSQNPDQNLTHWIWMYHNKTTKSEPQQS